MATAQQAKEFIKQIAPIIQKYAKLYGYKVASPIIAQACIESAFNTSVLGSRYHNYFGMKCGSAWKGKSVNLATKEEYTPGTLTNIRANWRVFDSMEEGVKGYFDFISAKRYQNLKTATTPREYLEFIKADGYATSSTYVNTNMSCISKYNLAKYDTFTAEEAQAKKGTEIKATFPTIRKGSSGKAVALWVGILEGEGYDPELKRGLVFDKDLDTLTRQYQNNKGLTVDGIVGGKTWTKGLEKL